MCIRDREWIEESQRTLKIVKEERPECIMAMMIQLTSAAYINDNQIAISLTKNDGNKYKEQLSKLSSKVGIVVRKSRQTNVVGYNIHGTSLYTCF